MHKCESNLNQTSYQNNNIDTTPSIEQSGNTALSSKSNSALNIKDSINYQIVICLHTDDENSFTHTKSLESVENPSTTILEFPFSQLFQKYWKHPHPLYVEWVAKNFKSLLWKWWIEDISYIPQKLSKHTEKVTSDASYLISDTLRFKLINSQLVWIFPNSLSQQLKEEWFETFNDVDIADLDHNADEANKFKDIFEHKNEDNSQTENDFLYDIVIKKIIWWKFALAVYRNWNLFMVTYVSVWKKTKPTKMGQFKIEWKYPYRRSQKYDNAAMPFALNYSWWFFLHQWNVTGNPASHWCIRLPGIYASILFSLVKNKSNTDIYIDKNLYK